VTAGTDSPSPPIRHLLYIEDAPENVRLIEHIFRVFGDLAVASAAHGGSGIELARQQRPELILLDLHLPDMTGDEVMIALRADPTTRDIPIVVLSGEPDPSACSRAIENGAAAYVPKPFVVSELVALVQRLISERAQAVADAYRSGLAPSP
jgi:CheY-like chemotaxis protein